MICEKCNSLLQYGAKYCNVCGESVPKGTFDEAYSRSVWGKLDKAKDRFDTVFLRKLQGSTVFKTISLIAALVWLFFSMYGNLTGIRLQENDGYSIAYSKSADIYYIRPNEDKAILDMFAPIGTESLVFTAKQGDTVVETKTFTPAEYKKEGYILAEGAQDYLEVEARRGEKVTDKVKIVVTGKNEVAE